MNELQKHQLKNQIEGKPKERDYKKEMWISGLMLLGAIIVLGILIIKDLSQ